MGLDDLRRRIDAIDDEILSLLEERANVVGEVARAKRSSQVPFYDPEREREVLERLAAKGAGRFPKPAIQAVYREVMSACLSLQEPIRVSFLGPEGTFTHMAARHLFGLAARYVEAATIDGVFDAVRRSAASYGVVPIENSTEGSVTHAVDALLEGGVVIRQEFVLEVSHALLSLAPRLTGIERVYSHPQALAQCRVWLAKNLATAQLIQTSSTAGGAREALADPAGAALGSVLAAEVYGLRVLAERIQDGADNATRFVMLANEDAPPTGDDKTTLAFSLRHEKGALRRVLDIFDGRGLNLTRIESRPKRERAWEYVFLVDVEGHREDAPVAETIAALHKSCAGVMVLGSYPRYRAAVLQGAVE